MIGRTRIEGAEACVAVLLALTLVACGGGGSGEETTPPAPTSVATTSSPNGSSGMVVPIEVGLATSDAQSSHGASLAVGDTLEIRLESEPASGYVWSLTNTPDKSVLRGSGKSEMVPATPAPGVTSKQIFTFTAVGKGWASVELSYADSSGGKPKRVSLFRIQVY